MSPESENYLGVKARLSQSWLASPLLLMIFYIAKLLLLRTAIDSAITVVMHLTMLECQNFVRVMNDAMQAPQEAIQVANKLVESAINNDINALKKSLGLTITVIENLIMFVLQMTIGTWSCLTISAVNVAGNEALNATESVIRAANTAAQDIGKDINKGLDKLSSLINSAEGLISTVDEFITGGTSDLKAVNLTVSKLNDLHISPNINAKLESLRKDIPTYDGTRSVVEKSIKSIFEPMRQQLNQFNTTITFSFNSSQLSDAVRTPPQCNAALITQNFAKLKSRIDLTISVLCGMCALIILSGILFNLWKSYSQWHRMMQFATSNDPFSGKLEISDSRGANIERILFTEAGYLERWCLLHLPTRAWWILRYIFAKPLISYLILGLAGILLSLIELGIINMLAEGAHFLYELERATLKGAEDDVRRVYSLWRNQTNARISSTETQVNTNVLGWVFTGSQGVNKSISTFMSSVTNDITKAFNDTPLLTPVQDAVNCLIGNKVKAIEEGLTWVHDHSQVSLPRVPQNVFPNTTSSLSREVQSTAGTVMKNAVATLRAQINIQLIVFGCITAVWIIFLLGALVYDKREILFTTVARLPNHRSKGPEQEATEKEEFESCSTTYYAGAKSDEHRYEKTLETPLKDNSSISRKRLPSELSIRPVSRNRRSSTSSPKIIPSPHSQSQQVPSPRVQSPIERLGNRVTRFFMSPAQPPTFEVIQPSRRASIVLPETPRTPLRAMLF